MRTPVTGILALVTLAGLASCSDRGEILLSPTADPLPPFALGAEAVDAAALSNPYFRFLPPLAPKDAEAGVQSAGEFDAALLDKLEVQICLWDGAECAASIVSFTSEKDNTTKKYGSSKTLRLSEEGEHYMVNWHMKHVLGDFPLASGQFYRIGVLAEDRLLGYLDLGLGSGGMGLVVMKNDVPVPVSPHKTIPIKFRVEVGAMTYDPDPGDPGNGDPPPPPPAPPVVTVTSGDWHACSTIDGVAYCWGSNGTGQVGIGRASVPVAPPQAVVGGLTFVEVSAGESHTCGRTAAGDAHCWGAGGNGRLGDGLSMTQTSPSAVAGGLSFGAVSAADEHTCGLVGGAPYCWGRNAEGQLGLGPTGGTVRLTPVASVGGLTFQAISTGWRFTCALVDATGGAAYCWGMNNDGKLGTGSTALWTINVPTLVTGGLSFVSVSAGRNHACGITTAGAAYCWGRNAEGQLGIGTATVAKPAPQLVTGGMTFTAISAGRDFTCGVTTGGAAYCWGRNNAGQLGAGPNLSPLVNYPTPQAVVGGHTFTSIETGQAYACSLTTDGDTFCWGSNSSSELGTTGMANSSEPVLSMSARPAP